MVGVYWLERVITRIHNTVVASSGTSTRATMVDVTYGAINGGVCGAMFYDNGARSAFNSMFGECRGVAFHKHRQRFMQHAPWARNDNVEYDRRRSSYRQRMGIPPGWAEKILVSAGERAQCISYTTDGGFRLDAMKLGGRVRLERGNQGKHPRLARRIAVGNREGAT